MADKGRRTRPRRSREGTAERFAELAKADPELRRRVLEKWGAGEAGEARRLVIEAVDGDDD